MPPSLVQVKAWVPFSAAAEPTTTPESLMSLANECAPPRVPRSVAPSASQRVACGAKPPLVFDLPTIWPLLLMRYASDESAPGERAVATPLCQENARETPFA